MYGVMLAIASFTLSFLIALFLLPPLSGLALKIGLVDYPNRRKIHRTPKPLVGGIAIMAAVLVTSCLLVPIDSLKGLLTGVLLLTLTGVIDDYREINHRIKFLFQILAALLMIRLSGNILYSFGDLLNVGDISLGSASGMITVFCTVGVINAINMIDGVDGLAGGVALISFMTFSVLAFINNQYPLMLVSLAFSGALVAFLRYNWHPSKLFMGDAGSITIGFVLAYLSIALTQKPALAVKPVVPLMVLAVPIVDTVVIMTRRMLRGKSPFHPDKHHLHHILLRFGLTKMQTVTVIILISLFFSGISIMGTRYSVKEHYLFMIFSLYFFVVFLSSFFIKHSLIAKLRFKRARTRTGIVPGKVMDIFIRWLVRLNILKRQKRVLVNESVIIRPPDNPEIKGQLLNISRGGFAAAFPVLILARDGVEFEMGIPVNGGGKPFNGLAQVLWVDKRGRHYHYGFRFKEIGEEDKRLLCNIEMCM